MYGAPYDVTARDLICLRLPRLVKFSCSALVLTLVCIAAPASAQYCTPDQCDECNLCACSQRCCHALPELWLVNTRCAPRCKNLNCGFDRLIYKRYDRKCCRWVRETRESFLAHEATMPSLFYVHGNSLNHKNAMKGCWQVYCKMRCCPGQKRLVFWSWPAERVFKTKGLRVREMIEKNLRIKYVYAEYQGYYMAKLVNQMSLTQRVMMSGHSYGGITTSAAAHLMGGGCLRGLMLAGGSAIERPNLRAAVISGAFDHDMLNPGNRYGQAFVAAEKIYVTRNVKDRTLKKWPKTSWRCKKAIGVLGVNANCLGVYRSKLCQQTMTADVGTSHYLKPHLKSVRFVAALCCLSFPQCQSSGCQPYAAVEDVPELPSTDLEVLPVSADLEQVGASQPHSLTAPADEVADAEEALEAEAELVTEFQFDSEEMELAFTEQTFADGPIAQPMLTVAADLTPLDVREVFGSQESAAEAFDTNFFCCETTLTDLNHSSVFAEPQSGAFLTPAEQEKILAAAARVKSQNLPAEPTPPSDQAGRTLQTAGPSGNTLWYQCGLGLAIVLTSQFYVLFSKRSTPS